MNNHLLTEYGYQKEADPGQIIKVLRSQANNETISLDAQLGSSPVSSLGVVPVARMKKNHEPQDSYDNIGSKYILDGVVSAQADPVRDGLVALLSDGQGALGPERLLGRLYQRTTKLDVRTNCQRHERLNG